MANLITKKIKTFYPVFYVLTVFDHRQVFCFFPQNDSKKQTDHGSFAINDNSFAINDNDKKNANDLWLPRPGPHAR